MPVSVGEAFAGFTILRVLGAGGMGLRCLSGRAHPRLPRQGRAEGAADAVDRGPAVPGAVSA